MSPHGRASSLDGRSERGLPEIRRLAAADLADLFEEHGGRKRGRALFCPFHDNHRTPAASIHRGRFHCFSCGVDLDPIGFVQRARGLDFAGALEFLAARYGVAIDRRRLSPGERAEWTAHRRAIRRDLPIARYWKWAALGVCDEVLEDCKAKLFAVGTDVTADELQRLTAFGVLLRRMDGPALVDEWKGWKRREPELTSALAHVGRARARGERRAIVAFLREEAG
jgi:hypothetical protein